MKRPKPNQNSLMNRNRLARRKPSLHQKQIRFFTFLFGTLLVLLVAGVLWIMNRLSPF